MFDRTEAVRYFLETVFTTQNSLSTFAPECQWTGLDSFLFDYGEFLAIDHYGLTKAGAGSSGYDAITPEGKTDQIKTKEASQTVGIRREADLLLVRNLQPDETWLERLTWMLCDMKVFASGLSGVLNGN